jgi:hypothetical protein
MGRASNVPVPQDGKRARQPARTHPGSLRRAKEGPSAKRTGRPRANKLRPQLRPEVPGEGGRAAFTSRLPRCFQVRALGRDSGLGLLSPNAPNRSVEQRGRNVARRPRDDAQYVVNLLRGGSAPGATGCDIATLLMNHFDHFFRIRLIPQRPRGNCCMNRTDSLSPRLRGPDLCFDGSAD